MNHPAPSPNDEIWYTSSDGNVVTLNSTSGFGANIVSNTYANGKGVIKFDGPVTRIGNDAFKNCTNLVSVDIPNSVKSIGNNAFIYCRNLTSVTIPDGVTSIGSGAFCGCSGLTSVTIPDSVTIIGDQAFGHCRSLTSVTIPDGVTSIGDDTFNECISLTSVTIPDGVTSIGKYAFGSCTGLASIVCMPTTPPTLSIDVFDDTNDCPIYVPAASVDTYKAANKWRSLASRIQAIQS